MKRIRDMRIWGYVYTTVLFAGLFFWNVTAAETVPSGAVVVRPAKAEVTIAPGEEKQVLIRVSNGTPSPLHVEASFDDVAPNTQTSAIDDPMRLLDGAKSDYSLRDFLEVPRQSFDLLTGKEVEVPITIRIPKATEPGGRYGSVVFLFTPLHAPANGGASVAFQSRIGALLYVRVSGEVREEGKLAAFGLFNNARTTHSPSLSKPLRMQVAYTNSGAVHLNPYGRITIHSMFGAVHVLPIDPWAVLPGATRMREIDMTELLSPGYYTAHLEQNRGYNNIVDERDVHFIVLPSVGEGLVGLAMCVLLLLIIRKSLRLSRHHV